MWCAPSEVLGKKPWELAEAKERTDVMLWRRPKALVPAVAEAAVPATAADADGGVVVAVDDSHASPEKETNEDFFTPPPPRPPAATDAAANDDDE